MKRQTVLRIAASLALATLALGGIVHAQAPREQLQQMVEQLQKTPNDNSLREKIIKLGAEIKPAPAISDTAIEFEGRAQFAFKNAKSKTDFVKAAEEYEKAIVSAPWVSGYYSDICTIYEKANKLADAKRNCQFYLIGLSDPAQITDIKRRIGGLKYGMEQNAAKQAEEQEATAARAAADTPQAREAALLQKVEGARFVDHTTLEDTRGASNYDLIYEIKDQTLYRTIRIYFLISGGTFTGTTNPASIYLTVFRTGMVRLL
jgi:hypothetical protein